MATKVLAGYPQMPPLNQQELENFLCKPLIARLGTVNEDGTVHLAPIYFKFEDGEFILGTQVVSRRVRNIKRNPNVTLLIDDPHGPYQGVMVYGKATLEYDQVIEKRARIFEKYSGDPKQARQSAEGLVSKWESVVIRIKPERFVSFDYAKASLL